MDKPGLFAHLYRCFAAICFFLLSVKILLNFDINTISILIFILILILFYAISYPFFPNNLILSLSSLSLYSKCFLLCFFLMDFVFLKRSSSSTASFSASSCSFLNISSSCFFVNFLVLIIISLLL
jgi:hypothetical protein